jgi:hypothetical protein
MERNKGSIIRLVDDYLKRQGLTEPRGGGPAGIIKAESHRALRNELIRTGSLVPLDEFRAMLGSGAAREAPPG